ncbi:MAG TPA: YhjD/YihY/BrkB family envelope integrity protein, partial [Xanthobacteraceae bacterium]|nr:YhjD/YihY/BrkB family envelope integrity protein [Xanthobacteraceae bacterium]
MGGNSLSTLEHPKRWSSGKAGGDLALVALAAALALSNMISGRARIASRIATEDRPGVNQPAGGGATRPSRIVSSDTSAAGWKDILWRMYQGISEHRVLAIAASVTFYALLAIFPAIAALVALYGLFADPGAVSGHLADLANFLPVGAIEIIGEQVDN